MKARGAVLHSIGSKWSVEDLEVGQPGPDEVLIQVMATGLCHSDAHFVDGDLIVDLPIVGGHEGAGVVVAVGEGVRKLKPGDHVCTLFIPACGQCKFCARGQSYICDNGAGMGTGRAMDDTYRFFLPDGTGVGGACRVGSFANYLVCHETQAVRIPDDVPFEVACLASCGVPTGWGGAVNAGPVRPGDVVLIAGAGGVGMNAVQGARHAGADHILVVDPAPFKREMAPQFGATETFASLDEASERIAHLTNGQGVDVAIVAIGRVDGESLGAVFDKVGKAGVCVLLSVGKPERHLAITPSTFNHTTARLQGVMFGLCNPMVDVPRLLRMYQDGSIKLDELVTRRYALDEINEAYDDMFAGRNLRGVVVHTH